VPVERVRVGQRVRTWLPGEAGFAAAAGAGGVAIDARTWRRVVLRREDGGGSWTEAELLRPVAWLAAQGVRGAGDRTVLDLPEMDASGVFQVLAVGACPAVEGGPGRVVTALFRHGRGRVYDVWVEGEPGAVGATGRHPFWSVDRRGWVAATALVSGERVQVAGRTAAVRAVTGAGDEPVFNLEVDADHCYRVGEQGILVHNASAEQECKTAGAKRQKTITNDNGTFSFTFDECRTTSAKGPIVGFPKKIYGTGSYGTTMRDLLLGKDTSVLAKTYQAGHLIGAQFGGPAQVENLVPFHRKLNLKGSA
jgi:hypothetical protein